VHVRTTFRRFTIDPAGSGIVTDRASGRKVARVCRDQEGNWRGRAFLDDGREYVTDPWLTAYAAADAAWLVATAGPRRPEPEGATL
jgi:hypothetical protein